MYIFSKRQRKNCSSFNYINRVHFSYYKSIVWIRFYELCLAFVYDSFSIEKRVVANKSGQEDLKPTNKFGIPVAEDGMFSFWPRRR